MSVALITRNAAAGTENFRFIDIGVNLTDPVFKGIYRGSRKHEGSLDDFDLVLDRAKKAGVRSMIITGGSLKESRTALNLAKQHNLFATAGCHPTRSAEFDKFAGGPDAYLSALDNLISANLQGPGRVVAVGECGLDYDRLHFAPASVQKTHFRSQLFLAKKYHLPLFLHSRAAHADFVQILRDEGFADGGFAAGGKGGVVHSFTGSKAELTELMGMGFHISVNGCSLKTAENLDTVKAILPEKLLLETDAPWCSMTSTHASKTLLDTLPTALRELYFPPGNKLDRFVYGQPVKGARNEPSAVGGVAWILHKLHEDESISMLKITENAYKNSVDLFGLQEIV